MRRFRAALFALSLATAPATSVAETADELQEAEFATRGFIGTREDPRIMAGDGRVVWDLNAYRFLDSPDAVRTVNPGLLRHQRLLARHGLFKVAERVYQVRGFDLANMTLVQGEHGWIIIDALTTVETARAALGLANRILGERPVTALIYTHSHVDHFGGARGVVDEVDVKAGRVPVVAPGGFLKEAVSENVLAGPAMARRAAYQFGAFLPRSATGQVGAGIGQGVATGTQSLIAPTREIARTEEELVLDGVRFRFQPTPGTEAPAEMNLFLPDLHVLDLAENANVTIHNVLTPRGALVRDAKAWADELSQALRLFGGEAQVLMTSHGWPRWGGDEIRLFIANHRDAYLYLHDQTVRLMNQGLIGPEIAAQLRLPAPLAAKPYNHGFYGELGFNAQAVYQRYMGFYDGNPVNLEPLPPEVAARKYVAAMGGAARVVKLARAAIAKNDDRWAAELLNRVVFADRTNMAARGLLAEVHRRFGLATENALWRNMHLTAADELERDGSRSGNAGTPLDLVRAMPTGVLLDLIATRVNPDRAGVSALAFVLVFPERNERQLVTLRNAVLVHEAAEPTARAPDIELSRAAFIGRMLGGLPLDPTQVKGDAAPLTALAGMLDRPKPEFDIVLP